MRVWCVITCNVERHPAVAPYEKKIILILRFYTERECVDVNLNNVKKKFTVGKWSGWWLRLYFRSVVLAC